MNKNQPSNVEMIDKLLIELYNQGDPASTNFDHFIQDNGWEFDNRRAYEKFKSEYFKTGCVNLRGDGLTWLNEKGLDIVEMYGKYSDYRAKEASRNLNHWTNEFKRERREQRRKNLEFFTKNAGSIVAILLSLSTLITTIGTGLRKPEQNSLTPILLQMQKELDSLKYSKEKPQSIINKEQAKDSVKP